jgi:hypothetical protein
VTKWSGKGALEEFFTRIKNNRDTRTWQGECFNAGNLTNKKPSITDGYIPRHIYSLKKQQHYYMPTFYPNKSDGSVKANLRFYIVHKTLTDHSTCVT